MLVFEGSPRLQRIVVLNPKGGSGKTTLAFNLAGYLAATGRNVAIIDMDPQGSSMRWLRNRSSGLPKILGIPAEVSYRDASGNQYMVVPGDIDCIVVDAPAGIPGDRLIDYTCGAHAIFVPVLPSDLDIHAASRLISDLLLKAQVSRRNERLCVVPNRVRERTIAYQQLCRFLARLSITIVGVVRDSQNYVWAAKNGTCIHEMPPSRVGKDRQLWGTISQWLERRLATPLNARDHLRPKQATGKALRKKPPTFPRLRIVAGVGLTAVAVGAYFAASGMEAMPVWSQVRPAPLDPVVQAADAEVSQFLKGRMTDVLDQRWRLNGTVTWGGSGLLFMKDRATDASLIVTRDQEFNGWEISEIGSDYAVFSQNGEQVRLELQYDTPF
jgi:chromosome partitioning protein